MSITRSTTAFLVALVLAGGLRAADRIDLTDGSVIFGQLQSVEGGKFKIVTTFAGTLEIPQAKVKSFATDEPVNVGLAIGRPVLGRVVASGGDITVITPGATVTSPTARVVEVWRKSADSPEIRREKAAAAAKVRHWSFEATAAITGRSGVEEKFGADIGFKATLANVSDKLVLTYSAQRATDQGVDTANRQYGSADYSSYDASNNGWYARTALEQDRIKLLDLRSTSAAGFGHKLIKNAREDLEARVGVDYLYENYSNNTSFESPGAEVALLHSYQFTNAKLTNSIVYAPAFKQFSNFRIHHESALELPLGASMWKLKLGLANDYASVQPDDVGKLDTTYFTSLLLNWK